MKKPAIVCAKRGGISWRLDLSEAIDLTIYLFGAFERNTIRQYRHWIKPGDHVIDVGANMGSHTLHLARCVGTTGTVHAFEPTRYAWDRLQKNLDLNRELKSRVQSQRAFLSSQLDAKLPSQEVYSSWPLTAFREVHQKHRGRAMPIDGAQIETLDSYIAKQKITRVSFIKIDVDGFELEVMKGALALLRRDHPRILMEFAPYLSRERGASFQELLNLLDGLGYRFIDERTGELYPPIETEIERKIGSGRSRNVLLC